MSFVPIYGDLLCQNLIVQDTISAPNCEIANLNINNLNEVEVDKFIVNVVEPEFNLTVFLRHFLNTPEDGGDEYDHSFQLQFRVIDNGISNYVEIINDFRPYDKIIEILGEFNPDKTYIFIFSFPTENNEEKYKKYFTNWIVGGGNSNKAPLIASNISGQAFINWDGPIIGASTTGIMFIVFGGVDFAGLTPTSVIQRQTLNIEKKFLYMDTIESINNNEIVVNTDLAVNGDLSVNALNVTSLTIDSSQIPTPIFQDSGWINLTFTHGTQSASVSCRFYRIFKMVLFQTEEDTVFANAPGSATRILCSTIPTDYRPTKRSTRLLRTRVGGGTPFWGIGYCNVLNGDIAIYAGTETTSNFGDVAGNGFSRCEFSYMLE